jgi:hypothetical protein
LEKITSPQKNCTDLMHGELVNEPK